MYVFIRKVEWLRDGETEIPLFSPFLKGLQQSRLGHPKARVQKRHLSLSWEKQCSVTDSCFRSRQTSCLKCIFNFQGNIQIFPELPYHLIFPLVGFISASPWLILHVIIKSFFLVIWISMQFNFYFLISDCEHFFFTAFSIHIYLSNFCPSSYPYSPTLLLAEA